MLVLVTGSCGFMMSNFIIYGQQETKWDFVSIDKLTTGSLYNISHNNTVYNKRHKLNIGDVCDLHFMTKILELERPDIIIHGAGVGNIHNYYKNKFDFDSNIVGIKTIMNACLSSHMPKKFINISSYDVYGNINNGFSKENDKLSPSTLYAGSKAAADLIAQTYCDSFGFPLITIRCANNFGPRQNKEDFIPRIIVDALKNSNSTIYGNVEDKRDWIYIKDTFKAIQTIVEKSDVRETYNIGTGIEKTNLEIAEFILKQFSGHVENKIIIKNSGLEKCKRYAINSDKIKNLGWSPVYNFEEAIIHFIGWMKSNPWSWR